MCPALGSFQRRERERERERERDRESGRKQPYDGVAAGSHEVDARRL